MGYNSTATEEMKRNGASFFFKGDRIEAQRSGFDSERKKEGADMELSPCLAEAEWSEFLLPKNRIEAQRSGFDSERKKEGADMELSPCLAEAEWSEFLLTNDRV